METLEADNDTKDEPTSGFSLRRPPIQVVAAALAVVLIAALILSIIEWQHYANRANSLSSLQRTESSALQAAESYGIDVGSYNYNNLYGPTASWTQIEDHSTPAFKSKYEQTTSLLAPTVKSYKGSATATVQTAAVSQVKGSTATVLIELDQTITNSTQKSGPQSETFIVTLTLVHQKGQWLISSVAASV